MNRRQFLRGLSARALLLSVAANAWPRWDRAVAAGAPPSPKPLLEAGIAADWRPRWQRYILDQARARSCDTEMGEELGWLVSPITNGFYYGYQATKDKKWLDRLMDWTDAVIKRAQNEPDGYPGWPKAPPGSNGASDYESDSLLGEAMILQPAILASAEILKNHDLEAKYGARARSYLALAGRIFQKWDSRDCWRTSGDGGVWVVPPFGVDPKARDKWSSGYVERKTGGFTNPANKQSFIACWLIALYDATGEAVYRERAAAWWRVLRSRMTLREDGKYFVWNYWDPGGPWDRAADGSWRHWIGVHPNGGYYGMDVEGIVTAFEHGLVFTKEDMDRLIATNRDFMWNQKLEGAKFQRIDGGPVDSRWPDTPGVLWTQLTPYDATLRKVFAATHNPGAWSGLATTPWALSATVRG